MSNKIGEVSEKVATLIGDSTLANQDILLGPSNIAHMQKKHPKDYAKYGKYIQQILSSPDYVGSNPKDNSIEYVKEFKVDGDFVKVAVRVSNSGNLYARTVYVLNSNRTHNYIQKGTLKKV